MVKTRLELQYSSSSGGAGGGGRVGNGDLVLFSDSN